MYACIDTYTYDCEHRPWNWKVCTFIYMYACIACMYVCMYRPVIIVNIDLGIRRYVHICVRSCIYVSVCMHTCLHIHIWLRTSTLGFQGMYMYSYMCARIACMYVCMYHPVIIASIDLGMRMYVHIHLHVHVCIYVCVFMHACSHTYTYDCEHQPWT